MLETARHCFTSAARCEGDGDEEEWLIHYMLGKVAEKQQQPPPVYLRHYGQASHLLHEEAARYPKKIHYHNPPELAMEALEVGCAGPGGRALPSQRPSPPGCSQSLLGGSVSPALQLQALVPAACSLGARRGSQLGHGGAEELRPSGPLGHGLACSSRADCVPCLGVRVGSGGTLGVLPGAHVVHEAGSKDMVQASGLLASWAWGSSAPFQAACPPHHSSAQKAAGNLGQSLLAYPFFVFTYLLQFIKLTIISG